MESIAIIGLLSLILVTLSVVILQVVEIWQESNNS